MDSVREEMARMERFVAVSAECAQYRDAIRRACGS